MIETLAIPTSRGVFTARMHGRVEDPLVLLLHGFPDVPSTFDGLAATLAASGFRAVAPHARGYVPSPPFPGPEDGAEASTFDVLGRDAVALVEALSPDRPAALVGHDNGGFTAYHAMAEAPECFSRAVTMTAGHPAAVFANTPTNPAQLWKSRYAFLFKIPKLADWVAERQGFEYLHELWQTWAAPGWTVPDAHWAEVRDTMERSWPIPLEHYRRMAFAGPTTPIATPTLFLIGDADGCVDVDATKGQEAYFSGPFEQRVIAGAGHFLHLERPDVVEPAVLDWLAR